MRRIIAFPVLLFFSLAAIYFSACNDNKKEPEATATSNKDFLDKALKRGEYLTLHVAMCLDCHSQPDFSKYSGPITPGTQGQVGEEFNQKLGVPGVIYARNITPDKETGVGDWSDEDLLKAMTRGISKNGDK